MQDLQLKLPQSKQLWSSYEETDCERGLRLRDDGGWGFGADSSRTKAAEVLGPPFFNHIVTIKTILSPCETSCLEFERTCNSEISGTCNYIPLSF